jgi:hypothetical protein
MILEVSWENLWTLSFGLSQFHGHGSWLMCEVALMGARDCLIFKVRLSTNDIVKGHFVTPELGGPLEP